MSAWDGHWVTWVTDTGVAVPVITAVAVLGTRVGITGVIHFAALLHVDLDSLFHVECSYICRCLSHSYSLVTKKNCFSIRVFNSIQNTVPCVSLLPLIHETTSEKKRNISQIFFQTLFPCKTRFAPGKVGGI